MMRRVLVTSIGSGSGLAALQSCRTGGGDWELLTDGLPQTNAWVNVLRDAMSTDTCDPCGVYFGTTEGTVYGSNDGGGSWSPVGEHLPRVLSVEAQVRA